MKINFLNAGNVYKHIPQLFFLKIKEIAHILSLLV